MLNVSMFTKLSQTFRSEATIMTVYIHKRNYPFVTQTDKYLAFQLVEICLVYMDSVR